MPGRLNGRVSRLENGRRGPCEECGFDGDWRNVDIVVEWAALHQDELAANWERARREEPLQPIEPLP